MAFSVKTSAMRCGSPASMPDFQRSRTWCTISVSCTLTTIHMKYLAGDERCVLQVYDGVDDVIDFAQPPQWVHLRESIVGRRVVHRGGDDAERHGVGPDAAVGELDRQRFGHRIEPALGQRCQRGRHA